MNNHEIAIELALKTVKDGMSERKAAKGYGISRSTLYNCHAGCTDTYWGHAIQLGLLPKQEGKLCSWKEEQKARVYAPSQKRVQEMTILQLKASSDDKAVGK
jgi:hypothetical protein